MQDSEQNELEELKQLLEKNTQAIEKLRGMIENMEVLLAKLEASKRGRAEENEGSPCC